MTLVQFILEGYEGLVTVSTIDPRAAVIQILIMPDFADEAKRILEHLKDRFMLQEIPSDRYGVSPC